MKKRIIGLVYWTYLALKLKKYDIFVVDSLQVNNMETFIKVRKIKHILIF